MGRSYIFEGHKLIYHPDRVNDYLQKNDTFPLYMEISPQGKCDSRCIFCAYDYIGYPNRRLDTNRFLSFLDEIAECGVKSLLYAGEGEPLLHPDIDKFIVYSKNRNIDVGMFTNGNLLKKELAEKILPSLTFIRFSFNGGTGENYSSIHQVKPEIFDTVVENIRASVRLREEGNLTVDIGAQFVLMPENRYFLVDAIKVLKDAGIDYFAIKPFIQQSSSQSYQMKEQFSIEEIKDLLDKAESFSGDSFRVIARRDSFAGYGKRGYRHCYGTSFISVLNSAGDIATCLPYWEREEFIFGNIYHNSFKDIWLGERRKKIKGFLEKELDVQKCPPNCRPNAINEYLFEIKNPSVKHINFI